MCVYSTKDVCSQEEKDCVVCDQTLFCFLQSSGQAKVCCLTKLNKVFQQTDHEVARKGLDNKLCLL